MVEENLKRLENEFMSRKSEETELKKYKWVHEHNFPNFLDWYSPSNDSYPVDAGNSYFAYDDNDMMRCLVSNIYPIKCVLLDMHDANDDVEDVEDIEDIEDAEDDEDVADNEDVKDVTNDEDAEDGTNDDVENGANDEDVKDSTNEDGEDNANDVENSGEVLKKLGFKMDADEDDNITQLEFPSENTEKIVDYLYKFIFNRFFDKNKDDYFTTNYPECYDECEFESKDFYVKGHTH